MVCHWLKAKEAFGRLSRSCRRHKEFSNTSGICHACVPHHILISVMWKRNPMLWCSPVPTWSRDCTYLKEQQEEEL